MEYTNNIKETSNDNFNEKIKLKTIDLNKVLLQKYLILDTKTKNKIPNLKTFNSKEKEEINFLNDSFGNKSSYCISSSSSTSSINNNNFSNNKNNKNYNENKNKNNKIVTDEFNIIKHYNDINNFNELINDKLITNNTKNKVLKDEFNTKTLNRMLSGSSLTFDSSNRREKKESNLTAIDESNKKKSFDKIHDFTVIDECNKKESFDEIPKVIISYYNDSLNESTIFPQKKNKQLKY